MFLFKLPGDNSVTDFITNSLCTYAKTIYAKRIEMLFIFIKKKKGINVVANFGRAS